MIIRTFGIFRPKLKHAFITIQMFPGNQGKLPLLYKCFPENRASFHNYTNASRKTGQAFITIQMLPGRQGKLP